MIDNIEKLLKDIGFKEIDVFSYSYEMLYNDILYEFYYNGLSKYYQLSYKTSEMLATQPYSKRTLILTNKYDEFMKVFNDTFKHIIRHRKINNLLNG